MGGKILYAKSLCDDDRERQDLKYEALAPRIAVVRLALGRVRAVSSPVAGFLAGEEQFS